MDNVCSLLIFFYHVSPWRQFCSKMPVMIEKINFQIHIKRGLLDLLRSLKWAADRHPARYSELLESVQKWWLIVNNKGRFPPVFIRVERVPNIAKRLHTGRKTVEKRIQRARWEGRKLELWSDQRGMVFPFGLFSDRKIGRYRRHRRPKHRP
jgi:hypothetical protein